MKNLLDLGNLASMISSDDIAKLGSKIGLSSDQTQSALTSSIPTLLGALSKKTENPEAAQNITQTIEKEYDGNLLSNVGDFFSKGDTSQGSNMLQNLLGSEKDTVAETVSKKSGIDLGSASKLLAMVAPLVMNFLGKKNKETPGNIGITDILGSFAGGNQSQNIVGKLLDKDNDGSVIDDVMDKGKGMLGKLF